MPNIEMWAYMIGGLLVGKLSLELPLAWTRRRRTRDLLLRCAGALRAQSRPINPADLDRGEIDYHVGRLLDDIDRFCETKRGQPIRPSNS
jgi:hypothetical protein